MNMCCADIYFVKLLYATTFYKYFIFLISLTETVKLLILGFRLVEMVST